MPTINTVINLSWQKIANDTDSTFSASWEATVDVELFATAANVAPAATVDGKRYRRENQLSRNLVGDGFIWARLSPGSKPASITALVNTSGSSGTANPFSAVANITTQNLVPAGAATANSAVEVSLNDATSLAIQVMGTYTGAISVQVTADGTNWVTLGGTPVLNVNTGALAATIASAAPGCYQVNVGGFTRARATGLAAMTGTATVTMRAHQGSGAIAPVVPPATQAVSLATNTPTLAAGTNLAADVGTQLRANSTGAATARHIVAAASTNATNVKASAGRVVGWNFTNTTASVQYVKLHNNAGTPTAGAGVVMTIAIPANGVNNMPVSPVGIGFATGIAYTIVTGPTDADAVATTLNSVVGDLHFA
jgi:hypothetical protein